MNRYGQSRLASWMVRRVPAAATAIVLAVLLGIGAVRMIAPPRVQGQSQDAKAVTPADYLRWQKEFKNWGRWGANDERGTSNLMTAEKTLSATRLVKAGIVVSLAHAAIQTPDAEIPAKSVFHRTTEGIYPTGTVDSYSVSYHGRAMAHMDSFCHFFGADGKMYNGFPASENLTAETGCKKDSVMSWRDGVVTRAVLYDMPQLKGVEWIEPGTPITRADLEAWEKKSGVKVGPGDIILLYVGRWKRRAAKGAPTDNAVAGYYADVIPWIKEREPAFIGHDANIDWNPRPGWGAEQGIPVNPIHQAVLNWLGVNIIENLDLEQAVATARRMKRYEFMLTFGPLPVEGGTGSPLNPLAVF